MAVDLIPWWIVMFETLALIILVALIVMGNPYTIYGMTRWFTRKNQIVMTFFTNRLASLEFKQVKQGRIKLTKDKDDKREVFVEKTYSTLRDGTAVHVIVENSDKTIDPLTPGQSSYDAHQIGSVITDSFYKGGEIERRKLAFNMNLIKIAVVFGLLAVAASAGAAYFAYKANSNIQDLPNFTGDLKNAINDFKNQVSGLQEDLESVIIRPHED